MVIHVKKMKLGNMSEAAEEIQYWSSKTIDERITALEILRNNLQKMKGTKRGNGNLKGLRRVLRVTKLK